ncbi:prolyl oligopeptidase family serine peptidase [Shewanella sp. GXUN23E]|uniref:alpha/beta hydrolase family protein n=1 Tax=Shewanella sp. GXUN23E TaxID=3422498 RepID=UPI003D7D5513
MRLFRLFCLAGLSLALLPQQFANAQTAAGSSVTELPIEAYAGLPNMAQLDLSPDGKRLAYRKNVDGTLVVMVYHLETGSNQMVLKSDNREVYLNWFRWLNNTNLLVSAQDVRRKNAIRYSVSRMYNVDVSGQVKITPALKIRKDDHNPQYQDQIISILPDDEDRILMQLDLTGNAMVGVYKVNPRTGLYQRQLRPKSNVSNWIADRQGQLRMGFGIEDNTAFYRLYDETSDSWRRFAEFPLFSPEAIDVKGFDKDPSVLYFTALHQGRKALFRQSLKDGASRELVYADPQFDVEGDLIYSPVSGEVIGFSHSNAQDSVIYWDEDMLTLQRSLAAALPDSHNVILDISRDGNKYLVFHSSASEPGIYLLGDRANKTLDFIGGRYEAINEQNYAGKRKVHFKARDGLQIAGYLTVPKSHKAGDTLPTIILPHGGPHARDFAGFDYWSELFASRGFLVLQPNFRGSSGYGYEFEMAALQDWGGAMQDDLQDAANYLIAEGLADPARICIGGGSYGGYAALMAVVKHPETFRCAASFAGVSDLENMVAQRLRYFANTEVVEAQFGKDWDKLAAVSPINFVDKINRPILLVHGTDDSRVFVDQSRDMANALKRADKQVTYIELEDGDHHLSNQAHRITALEAFLQFFDTHLRP